MLWRDVRDHLQAQAQNRTATLKPIPEQKHRIPGANSYLAFCLRMTLIFLNATGIFFEDRQLAEILKYSDAVCAIGFGHMSLWSQALLAGLFSI